MPDRTFALKGEKCHGGKLSKERVTVFIGANADGSEKLKPLVIGKSIKPRCFKNIKNLPCDYVNQNRAWMTAALFATRVRELDVQMQKNNRKILLFVDNCTAHTKDIPGLKHVRIEFLPPNSTSVLQPMDLGVIKVLKQQYRKRLVQRYPRNMEIDEVRPITLLDAMYFLTWEGVKPETVANCFRKAFATENDDVSIETEDLNNHDLADLQEDWCAARKRFQDDSITLENYIDIDEGVCTSELRSIDDIIEDVKAEVSSGEQDASYEADDDPEPLPIPTFSSVVTAFDVVRRYVSAMNGPSTEEIFPLINAAENAINKNRVLRQSKIDDFGHK